MQPNNGARTDLFPSDDELTPWQIARKEANLHILSQNQAYYHNKKNSYDTGFTEPFDSGNYIINQGQGPNCSGTNLQSFLLALQLWFGDIPLSDPLTSDDFREIYRHFHAVDTNHILGGTGALLYLAGVWPWLEVDAFVGVELRRLEQLERMQPFSVLSFQNGKTWTNGHSTQFIGLMDDFDEEEEESKEGKTVLLTFEASNNFDNSWLTKNQKPGVGFNWWNPLVRSGGWTRTAFYAHILNDGEVEDYL